MKGGIVTCLQKSDSSESNAKYVQCRNKLCLPVTNSRPTWCQDSFRNFLQKFRSSSKKILFSLRAGVTSKGRRSKLVKITENQPKKVFF
jgi:hypothetical protein